MRPPGYRNADRNRIDIPIKPCVECIHERAFRGLPVCLKYFVQLRVDKTCDDWDGGEVVGHAPEVGLFSNAHLHNSMPDDLETEVLESVEIVDLDDIPPPKPPSEPEPKPQPKPRKIEIIVVD